MAHSEREKHSDRYCFHFASSISLGPFSVLVPECFFFPEALVIYVDWPMKSRKSSFTAQPALGIDKVCSRRSPPVHISCTQRYPRGSEHVAAISVLRVMVRVTKQICLGTHALRTILLCPARVRNLNSQTQTFSNFLPPNSTFSQNQSYFMIGGQVS